MGNFKTLCELTADLIDTRKVSNKKLDRVLKSTMQKTDCGYIFKILFGNGHKDHTEEHHCDYRLYNCEHDNYYPETHTDETPEPEYQNSHRDHTDYNESQHLDKSYSESSHHTDSDGGHKDYNENAHTDRTGN